MINLTKSNLTKVLHPVNAFRLLGQSNPLVGRIDTDLMNSLSG